MTKVGFELDNEVHQALGGKGHSLPWSTTDSIAATLLSKATRRGWLWTVTNNTGLQRLVDCGIGVDGPLGMCHVKAPTFAEAVSRAFVAAAKESS